MFVQTVYESRITGNFGPLALLALQKSAVIRNQEKGITSFLYHNNKRIFHVVEGYPDVLQDTMERIGMSAQHNDIKVRASLRCKKRSFPRWYFGATNAGDPHFQRVFRALNKSAFFNLDVVEAIQILQMVASRKRRAVKMDQFSIKVRNFNLSKEPRDLLAVK